LLQTSQQTGAALGVAALTSIAISHGQSDALLTAAGLIVVAFAVAVLAIRPPRPARATSPEELAEELEPLAFME
jgi:hypothetical protein